MDLESVRKQLLSLSLLTSEESAVYIERLEEDIKKNKKEQSKIVSDRREIENLEEFLDTLSEHAQKSVLFKVSPICALPVTLIHTGEYKVKVGPDTFTLNSLKETKSYLERKRNALSESLEAYKVQHDELEARLNFSLSNKPGEEEMLELANMPDKIVSEKGVAVKLRTGFEILEIEQEPIVTPRQKRKKQTTEVDYDVFERLEQLEEQESLYHELEDN